MLSSSVLHDDRRHTTSSHARVPLVRMHMPPPPLHASSERATAAPTTRFVASKHGGGSGKHHKRVIGRAAAAAAASACYSSSRHHGTDVFDAEDQRPSEAEVTKRLESLMMMDGLGSPPPSSGRKRKERCDKAAAALSEIERYGATPQELCEVVENIMPLLRWMKTHMPEDTQAIHDFEALMARAQMMLCIEKTQWEQDEKMRIAQKEYEAKQKEAMLKKQQEAMQKQQQQQEATQRQPQSSSSGSSFASSNEETMDTEDGE